MKGSKLNNKDLWTIALNSTSFFLLSYLIIYILTQLAACIAASNFEIPSILYFNSVYYNIIAADWTPDSVKIVFSSGPLLALFIGLILLIIYSKIFQNNNLAKILVLWGIFHAFNIFFGSLLVGTLLGKSLGHVLSWMYFKDTAKMTISIIALFGTFGFGLITAKPFIFSSNLYLNNYTEHNRRKFILGQLVIPLIIGSLFIYLLKLPNISYYEIGTIITMIIMMLPIHLKYKSFQDYYFDEDEKKIKIAKVWVIVTIIVILLSRVILGIGLRFN
ncbi:MAG: hypothetical protein JEY97_10670 [Bacteroidales bacterium]|nr:hypothetical protein [Bacteroidales bacterium]